MLKTSHNKSLESGSAHVWLVVVLIVIIIGLLGFVFWQQLTKPETNSPTTASNTSNTDTPSNTSTTKTYAGRSAYVDTFTYPETWKSLTPEEACSELEFCASPPTIVLVSPENKVKLTLNLPQSASDMTIDEQAASSAGDTGKIAPNFTSLDDIEARKIEYPNGNVDVIVSLRGGYGQLSFLNSVSSTDINTVLSSWKWSK